MFDEDSHDSNRPRRDFTLEIVQIIMKLTLLHFFLFVCLSDGRHEAVSFDKITSRIQKLCYGLNCDFVDPVSSKQHQNKKEM